jgi:predicted nuclease with RNAse H fold
MAFLGVDLRSSPKHSSAVVALNHQSEMICSETFRTDVDLLEIAKYQNPELIAIGTPLGLPVGLHCLETSCSKCSGKMPQRKGRQLEQELAQMGISCFFTSKGSIIRPLIYRGIRLSDQLRGLGFDVIEVYPYATKVILFGDNVPSKSSPKNLPFMKERLPSLIPGLETCIDTLDSRTCDALISAYTALLHSRNRTDLLGNAEEGLLALPKLFPPDELLPVSV